MKITLRKLAPLIAYIAVLIGMYGLGSAFAAIGLYHAGIIAITLTHRKEQPALANQRTAPQLYLAALIYASGGFIFYLIWPYLSPDSGSIAAKLENFGITKHSWPYFAVYFCLVNAVIEELFWREYLGSDCINVQLNDILFGGYHVLVLLAFISPIWTVLVLIACTFAGWLWRMLRKLSGGLVLPICTHVIADIGIILAVHFRLFAN